MNKSVFSSSFFQNESETFSESDTFISMKTVFSSLSYSCSCFNTAPVFWEKFDPTCPYQVTMTEKVFFRAEEILGLRI